MARAGVVYVNVRGNTVPFVADMRAALDGPLRGIGALAGTAALGLGAVGVAAVKASTDFNQGISGVGAVADATSQQLAQLRDAALDAGAATVFSATDAATAEAELARAGVATTDVLQGGLRGALDLAAAGQIDLGAAAEIAGKALNIFNLEGDQTGHVADLLAAAANKSAADVQGLGQSLVQAGGVAASTGLSIEDTVGTLALFADNAIAASDGGTSLRTMLGRLTPQSQEARAAMEQLGLDFYDAQGRFVGIEEAAKRLQTSLSGLTEEQRNQAVLTIFGQDAQRGALALYKEGAEGVREYVDAVNDQGAAQRVAAVQLDNLAGDLEQFRGSVETALIGFGSLGDSALRELVQTGTQFVNTLGGLADDPVFQSLVDNVVATLGQIAGAFDGIGGNMTSLFAGLDDADVDDFFDSLRDSLEGLEGPLAGLAGYLTLLSTTHIPFIGPELGRILPSISPVTAVLGGLVLQSEEGRAALTTLFDAGAQAAETFAPLIGLAASAMGTLAEQTWLVVPAMDAFVAYKIVSTVTPWITSLNNLRLTLRSTFAELAAGGSSRTAGLYQLGAGALVAEGQVFRFGAAAEVAAGEATELGVRSLTAATQVAAIGPAAQAAALALTRAQAAMGALGTGARGWEFWTPEAEASLARAGTQIQAVQQIGRGSFIDVESWEDGVDRLALGAGTVSTAAEATESRMSRFGASLRGLSATAGGVTKNAMSSLGTALGGVNFATVGVTAAITGGLVWYQNWAEDVGRVKDETEDLTRSLLDQIDLNAGAILAQQFAQILDTRGDPEDGFAAAFAKTGLAISDVTSIVNENAGAIDDFRSKWQTAGESVDNLGGADGQAAFLDQLDEGIRPLIENLFALNEAGVISDHELRQVIDAMSDLDQEAAGAGNGLQVQAQRMKEQAEAAGIAIAGNRDFEIALSKNSSLEERRLALDRLKSAYPELAEAAGLSGGAQADAAAEADAVAGGIEKLVTVFGLVNPSATDAAAGLSAFGAAGEDALDSVAGLLSAQNSLVDANQRVEDARTKLANILSGNTDGLRSAKEALDDAQDAYTDAVEANTERAAEALDRFKAAEDKLADAQRKAGLNATSKEVQLGALDVEGPDLAREVDEAQRGLDKARRELDEANSGQSDQLVNARERVADAQQKVAEETAKTGPASREARDAQRELDAAQLGVVTSADAVNDAMGALAEGDILGAIEQIRVLGEKNLLTKDQVDGATAAILRQAAALQVLTGGSAVPPTAGVAGAGSVSPNPTTANGRMSPGFGNADRQQPGGTNSNGIGSAIGRAIAGAVPSGERDLGAFIRQFPTNPKTSQAFSIGGRSFVWNGSDWVGGDKQSAFEKWKVQGFALGGVVPGFGTGDTVPAMLTPGEFVINKTAVAALGPELLHELNAQRFATGGPVGTIPAAPSRALATTAVLDDDRIVSALEQLGIKLDALLYQRPNVTVGRYEVNEATRQRSFAEIVEDAANASYGFR